MFQTLTAVISLKYYISFTFLIKNKYINLLIDIKHKLYVYGEKKRDKRNRKINKNKRSLSFHFAV